eukprot:Awhi_evm1s5660
MCGFITITTTAIATNIVTSRITTKKTKKEESNYDTFSSSPKGMNSDEEYLIADKRPE